MLRVSEDGREDALVHESGNQLVIVCLLGCRGLALEDPHLLVLIICRTRLFTRQLYPSH